MEIHGGYLKEIKGMHMRRFPGGKRVVKVSISTWIGMSFGAKHWYADIQEEFNPLWDKNEHAWRECWDDFIGQGKKFHRNCLSEAEAVSWCAKMIPKHFKPSLHKLQYDTMGHHTLGKIEGFEIERV
jgi:hypothetical protein